jgi:hypothetical protein
VAQCVGPEFKPQYHKKKKKIYWKDTREFCGTKTGLNLLVFKGKGNLKESVRHPSTTCQIMSLT